MKLRTTSARLYLSVAIFLILGSCNSLRKSDDTTVYQHAIENSMYPTSKKVCNKLVEINAENKNLIRKIINNEEHILMLTWKAKNYYPNEGTYNTGSYDIWVTTAPELYNKMKDVKAAKQSMRLKQLLGLPPDAQNKIFIEFWVKPADLFRPCPDKEINDRCCNICFTKADSVDSDYIKWINTGRIDRYYANGLYNQYPWTQLGYTYDWNPKNKSHIGVSEFVIKKNSIIYVNKAYTTEEYLTVRK